MNEQNLREEQLSSELIYDGRIMRIERDVIRLPGGHEGVREVMRHVGAVCIVPVNDQNEIYVERQFRYPFNEVITEIPAGKLDSKAEDPLAAARRELWEETGLTADTWTSLGLMYSAPAYSDEAIHVFLATDLHEGASHLDEDEFLFVEKRPIAAVIEEIMAGKIPDCKTQMAVLKAARILML
ncbi:MAG: NUDIX hydrolase [Lachnospiraceae bacterium]|nr:NUDIX hydrolase [Lachnospiraceae bacterium]